MQFIRHLLIAGVCATAPLLAATFTQNQELTAPNTKDFGFSVAMSGDVAMVGDPLMTLGANTNEGAVWVYVRSGGKWKRTQRLTDPHGYAKEGFGTFIALNGDTALISMQPLYGYTKGQVFVFVNQGGTWVQQQILTASDGTIFDDFGGFGLALEGDTAVIGANTKTIDSHQYQGAAYVFTRNGTVWSQQQELTAAAGAAKEFFGDTVSISGNTLLIGAPGWSGLNQGAAYVFVLNGDKWVHQQKLTAANGAAIDSFGICLSLSGNTALIGAPGKEIGTYSKQGAAYVFGRKDGVWTEHQQLEAADGVALDTFGCGVMNGSTALITALGQKNGTLIPQGAVYVFNETGGVWKQTQELHDAPSSAQGFFGIGLALEGNTALIGGFSQPDAGAVYEYVK